MRIIKKVYGGLRKHCRGNPKKESCGYIFGKDDLVKSTTRGKNLDDSPVSYTIDPESTLKSVFRKSFMGVYHSHLGEPVPSGIDKSVKKYPNKYYLIYSISQDKLRAYYWDGFRFAEEEVFVELMER